MKKTTLFLAAIFCIGLINAQTNLLTNPGFETWEEGNAEPWDFYVYQNENVVFSQETSIVNEGTSAVRVDNPSTGATANVSQQYSTDLTVGETYIVSFRYYVVSGDNTDVRIWAGWKNGSGDIEHDWDVLRLGGGSTTEYLPSNTGNWSSYSVETTVPAGATLFDFRVRSYKGSVAIFDNCSFVKKEGGETNLISLSKDTPSFFVSGKQLMTENVEDGTMVEIYNAVGAKVTTSFVIGNAVELNNTLNKGIYIIKAGNYTQKIMF